MWDQVEQLHSAMENRSKTMLNKHQPCKKCHKIGPDASSSLLQSQLAKTLMPRFKRCGKPCFNIGAGWWACSNWCGHGSNNKGKCLCPPASTTILTRPAQSSCHEATPLGWGPMLNPEYQRLKRTDNSTVEGSLRLSPRRQTSEARVLFRWKRVTR